MASPRAGVEISKESGAVGKHEDIKYDIAGRQREIVYAQLRGKPAHEHEGQVCQQHRDDDRQAEKEALAKKRIQ